MEFFFFFFFLCVDGAAGFHASINANICGQVLFFCRAFVRELMSYLGFALRYKLTGNYGVD